MEARQQGLVVFEDGVAERGLTLLTAALGAVPVVAASAHEPTWQGDLPEDAAAAAMVGSLLRFRQAVHGDKMFGVVPGTAADGKILVWPVGLCSPGE